MKKLAKNVHFMTRKHWIARNNYEELTSFVAEDLEESDLRCNSQTMKRNATYLSVATFDELQSALSKLIKTGTAMELPWLINLLLEQMSRLVCQTRQNVVYL